MVTAIDLFAGAGGFTEGARLAGVQVVWSADHWQAACDIHYLNHPNHKPICQDLNQCDFQQVPDHQILLASSACQGHAKARGKERPHHDSMRSTAWAIVAAAEAKSPEAIVCENVPEFMNWRQFPAWKLAIELLGYTVKCQVLNAADIGVPQSRERVFVVAVRESDVSIPVPNTPHVPARSIINTNVNVGRWSLVNKPGRAAKTLARVESGRIRFGNEFVMPYYGSGSGLTGRSLDRPLGTVTTLDRWAVVSGDKMRMLTVEEYRTAMGFPDSYVLPLGRVDAIKMLGNAVPPPLAAYVINCVKSCI